MNFIHWMQRIHRPTARTKSIDYRSLGRVRHVRLFQRGNLVGGKFHVHGCESIVEMVQLVAPTIGAVMPGLASNHASATCARGTPRAAATRLTDFNR